MRLDKALRREKKRRRKDKMIVDGRSVFTIKDTMKKRDREILKRRKEKEKLLYAEL